MPALSIDPIRTFIKFFSPGEDPDKDCRLHFVIIFFEFGQFLSLLLSFMIMTFVKNTDPLLNELHRILGGGRKFRVLIVFALPFLHQLTTFDGHCKKRCDEIP
jgi:hypothetical protein